MKKLIFTFIFVMISYPVFASQHTDLKAQLAQLQAQQKQMQQEQAILQADDNAYQDSLVQQKYQAQQDAYNKSREQVDSSSNDGVYSNLPYNQTVY